MQKNTDKNRAMTYDLSGNGNHATHFNFLYGEKDYSQENAKLTITKVGTTSKGYNLYNNKIKSYEVLQGGKYIFLTPFKTIKANETISATVWVKYSGEADYLTPRLLIYKTAKDATETNMHLKLEEMNLTANAVKDENGFTKIHATYTNNTGADMTDVYIFFYGARTKTDYLENGDRIDTQFYIESVNDGVTMLRSGYFDNKLITDGIDDFVQTPINNIDITNFTLNIKMDLSNIYQQNRTRAIFSNRSNSFYTAEGIGIELTSLADYITIRIADGTTIYSKNLLNVLEYIDLTVISSNGKIDVIRNGERTTENTTLVSKVSPRPITFGDRSNLTPKYPTKIEIQKFQIFNRPLTEEEIANL